MATSAQRNTASIPTGSVNTARGPIEASQLGATLMHEHLFVVSLEIQANWPGYPEGWDVDHYVQVAVSRLAELQARGISTLVDLTVVGLGRYVPWVLRVAEQTDVNIVLATGIYVFSDLPLYFQLRGPGTMFGGPDRLAEFFIRDISEGIGNTGAKASILKCATDEAGLTRDVDRVLRAVSHAHRQTGAPISTHTNASLQRGLDQQRVFRQEGVDLTRVVIGHSGDTDDYDYLERLIDAGSYLGMDRFGVDAIPVQKRVEIVAEMCRRGHADKLVLSHDAFCFGDLNDAERRAKANPDWNWNHIPDTIIPGLLADGVEPEQIHQMMVVNPARILTHSGPY
jgi:phosphotriesterase-related protein